MTGNLIKYDERGRAGFHRLRAGRFQRGYTMVELLVALALSTIIAMAAVAALIVARQGFTAVDATSQLRDNGRFASDLIQRLSVQSGFQDVMFAGATRDSEFEVKGATVNPVPNITGFDNALIKVSSLPIVPDAFIARTSATSAQSGCSSTTDTACSNGSDVLVLRYQTSEGTLNSGVPDGTMINCVGAPETVFPTTKEDRIVSILHVARSDGGEPSLMCSYLGSSGTWQSEPIVEGVESFQVLYGVDGFTTGVKTQFTGPQDTVPDKYVRASDMVVANSPESAATYSNWRRVRSIRVGLVIRGPANSAAVKATNLSKMCALGVNPDVPANCVDESASETPPMGSEFPRKGAVTPDDRRLRQVITFTVFMRNVQSQ
jgi:type IV pilus assembly protein PilW